MEYRTPEFMAKVLDAYGFDYTQSKIMCPFHGDINPSMSIDLAKSRVFCFACQKSFDPIQFVEASEPKANKLMIYKRLAEIDQGVKIELQPQHIQEHSAEEFEELRINAKDYYYNLPKTDWTKEWTDELDYMSDRGFSSEILNACGAKLNYNSYYPIVFPIMDNGKFMGWVARTTSQTIEKERKYLYNRGFRRKLCLCGRYDNKSPLIVCEGYMDMLKLRQAGARNVVALLGWKMSTEQYEKLKAAGITEIVSALDNDEAGIKGWEFLKTLAFEHLTQWQFANGAKDPGEMAQNTIKKFLKTLKKSIDIGLFL